MSDISQIPAGSVEPPVFSAFTDTTGLTRTLQILLAIGAFFLIFAIWSDWLEVEMLSSALAGNPPTEAQAEVNDLRQGAMGLVGLLLFVVTGIVFLTWIYRANQNTRALGAEGMKFTPGWSIGWFFVPVANVIKPYYVMDEIYRGSRSGGAAWKTGESIRIVGIWWGLHILSGAVSFLSGRMSLRAETVGEMYNASVLTLSADALDLLLHITAYILVGKIFEMQITRARMTG